MHYEITDKYGIGESKMGESCHGPHHGFKEGPASFLKMQKELLKVGRSWKTLKPLIINRPHFCTRLFITTCRHLSSRELLEI